MPGMVFCQDRHERGVRSAFADKIPEKVRYAERNDERLGKYSGTEIIRYEYVPGKTKDPAREGRQADKPCRLN